MAGCVGTLGEESRVLPWCLLQEGDKQSHTEALELVSALIHFGQSRLRNSYSFSIAVENACLWTPVFCGGVTPAPPGGRTLANQWLSPRQSHTLNRGRSWEITKAMSRVVQMLGAGSLFLACHQGGPLRFCSENKGAKGLGGA